MFVVTVDLVEFTERYYPPCSNTDAHITLLPPATVLRPQFIAKGCPEISEMFRTTVARFAESISKSPLTLQQASAALLPPIPLYRALLRAHRYLPVDMRSLGDDYVKAEFRRHQKIDNPLHIIGFLSQWKLYLDELPDDPSKEFKGRKLDPTIMQKMSAEQLGQLYELMHATKDVWKPAAAPTSRDDTNN